MSVKSSTKSSRDEFTQTLIGLVLEAPIYTTSSVVTSHARFLNFLAYKMHFFGTHVL